MKKKRTPNPDEIAKTVKHMLKVGAQWRKAHSARKTKVRTPR
jgi:hypothetical protein